MTSVERTVVVGRSIRDVWAFLADFRTTEDWDPPTISTERTGGTGGPGTTYHNVAKFHGERAELDYVVLDCVDHLLLTLRGVGANVEVLLSFRFRATAAAGTEVTYRAEFRPRHQAPLGAAFEPAAVRIFGDYVAESLEDSLEHLSRV